MAQAVISMDQRHPNLLTINPTKELANNVAGIMTKLNVDVNEKLVIAKAFGESYSNQQKLNGMSTAEIRKEFTRGVLGVKMDEAPALAQKDAELGDKFGKDCAKIVESGDFTPTGDDE